jgi:UDP-N-acetylglucosamine 2-epimerase (non-hydrolysing)
MKILHVVGARPNFMKLAPVYFSFAEKKIHQVVVHTGQHYSNNMSAIFFQELGLNEPDINMEIGSGSHAEQVAKIMLGFEKIVLEQKPSWVFVYGDVNSTVAAALVCSKLAIPVAHVEAGLRSFDRTMPEELNRIVTDQLSDLFLIPSMDANENLQKEGIDSKKIHFVGNVMIDTLIKYLDKPYQLQNRLPNQFGVLTLHRPSNVDDPVKLKTILEVLENITNQIPFIFPVHPRTRMQIEKLKFASNKNLIITDPLGYLEFINIIKNAKLIITDSGGIQEETTYLKIPCLTLRSNTERPVTVSIGSNTLIGDDYDLLLKNVSEILNNNYKKGEIPHFWDGKAAERITTIILA